MGSLLSLFEANAAAVMTSSSETPGNILISPILMEFCVIVPVLSEQRISIPAISSMALSRLTIASFFASATAPTAKGYSQYRRKCNGNCCYHEDKSKLKCFKEGSDRMIETIIIILTSTIARMMR